MLEQLGLIGTIPDEQESPEEPDTESDQEVSVSPEKWDEYAVAGGPAKCDPNPGGPRRESVQSGSTVSTTRKGTSGQQMNVFRENHVSFCKYRNLNFKF